MCASLEEMISVKAVITECRNRVTLQEYKNPYANHINNELIFIVFLITLRVFFNNCIPFLKKVIAF
jgi:hypothetical protein